MTQLKLITTSSELARSPWYSRLTVQKHIGHLIRDARIRNGLKAEDVAKACNVSRSRVYAWEQSRFILPKNLKSLSRALNFPLKRLQAENSSSVRKWRS